MVYNYVKGTVGHPLLLFFFVHVQRFPQKAWVLYVLWSPIFSQTVSYLKITSDLEIQTDALSTFYTELRHY